MKDAVLGEGDPDAGTVVAYFELFDRLRPAEELYGWAPPMHAKAWVRVKPKRYFCDSSLAAALLGA